MSVLEYAAAMGSPPAEAIITEPLAKGKDKTPEHEKSVAWTDEEILVLNGASVRTGSESIKKRFAPGKLVWHDGCYFIPMMLQLTGFRSSEAAGLSLAEVYEDHVVPYIHLRFTEFRGLKGITLRAWRRSHPNHLVQRVEIALEAKCFGANGKIR